MSPGTPRAEQQPDAAKAGCGNTAGAKGKKSSPIKKLWNSRFIASGRKNVGRLLMSIQTALTFLVTLPWVKIVYTLVLVGLIGVLTSEIRRLWLDNTLYVGTFEYVAGGVKDENEGKTFALRILDRHQELRHRFTTANPTQFAAEAGLSPTDATPISGSETALSELAITVQSINVTDILSKLRRWVSRPREIGGNVAVTDNVFRSTVHVGDQIRRLADNRPVESSMHFSGLASADDAAFEIACALIWRQAATRQMEIAALTKRDFCNWSRAWVTYLNLAEKSQQLAGLNEEEIKALK